MNSHLLDNITIDELDKLKCNFKQDINSNRSFEQILTVQDLIDILIIRDVVSENNLDVLLEAIENFGKPVHTNNLGNCNTSIAKRRISNKVVSLLCNHIGNDWKELLYHLIGENDLSCVSGPTEEYVLKILNIFEENCKDVCDGELYYRLGRALKKCKRYDLESELCGIEREEKQK